MSEMRDFERFPAQSRETSPFGLSDMPLDMIDLPRSLSTEKRGSSMTSNHKKSSKNATNNKFRTVEDQIQHFRNQNDACKKKIMKLEKQMNMGMDLERSGYNSPDGFKSPKEVSTLKVNSRKSQNSKSKSTSMQSNAYNNIIK